MAWQRQQFEPYYSLEEIGKFGLDSKKNKNNDHESEYLDNDELRKLNDKPRETSDVYLANFIQDSTSYTQSNSKDAKRYSKAFYQAKALDQKQITLEVLKNAFSLIEKNWEIIKNKKKESIEAWEQEFLKNIFFKYIQVPRHKKYKKLLLGILHHPQLNQLVFQTLEFFNTYFKKDLEEGELDKEISPQSLVIFWRAYLDKLVDLNFWSAPPKASKQSTEKPRKKNHDFSVELSLSKIDETISQTLTNVKIFRQHITDDCKRKNITDEKELKKEYLKHESDQLFKETILHGLCEHADLLIECWNYIKLKKHQWEKINIPGMDAHSKSKLLCAFFDFFEKDSLELHSEISVQIAILKEKNISSFGELKEWFFSYLFFRINTEDLRNFKKMIDQETYPSLALDEKEISYFSVTRDQISTLSDNKSLSEEKSTRSSFFLELWRKISGFFRDIKEFFKPYFCCKGEEKRLKPSIRLPSCSAKDEDLLSRSFSKQLPILSSTATMPFQVSDSHHSPVSFLGKIPDNFSGKKSVDNEPKPPTGPNDTQYLSRSPNR